MYMQKKNNNPGINITKNDVAKLISRPYMKAMSLENLVSAFRRTGLYRFDNSVILDSEVAPATIYNTSQNVSTEPEDLDITASEPKAQPFAGSESCLRQIVSMIQLLNFVLLLMTEQLLRPKL